MSKGCRSYLPEQDLLLPPSLRHWLPESHLAYFAGDVVDQLDLSEIHAGKHARGFRRFSLRGLAKVLSEWAFVCLAHNILKLYRMCYP